MKKVTLFLAAILLICIFTSACRKEELINTGQSAGIPDVDKTDAYEPETIVPDMLYPVTIGEYEVSMNEYAYYFFLTKKSTEQYRNETWEKESSREELKAETLNYLTHQYTIRKMAKNYGLSLNTDDRQRIDRYIRVMEADKGGPEEFMRYMDENHLTEELLEHINETGILEEKIIESLAAEETPELIAERLNATWFRTQHIMIEVGEKYDESERLEYAQSIYNRAINGEDFSELAATYNEDPDNAEEYFFTLDERKLRYEDEVFELEPGQISEVFWSAGSFYIVKRLPLTDEQISLKSEEVRSRGSYEKFGDLFDTVRRGMKITFDPEYDLIDVDTMK